MYEIKSLKDFYQGKKFPFIKEEKINTNTVLSDPFENLVKHKSDAIMDYLVLSFIIMQALKQGKGFKEKDGLIFLMSED